MRLRRLMGVSVGSVLAFLLRLLNWAAVPALGFWAWWTYRKPPAILQGIGEDWKLLAAIVAATVFARIDSTRLRKWLHFRVAATDRSSYFELGLRTLSKCIDLRRRAPLDMCTVWEPLLKAAAMELEFQLGVDAGAKLKTNLLVPADPNSKKTVKVLARSAPGSPCPQTYETDQTMPAYVAMTENRTAVRSRITAANRPYRSVAATPIVAGDKAYGAITADSQEARTFAGREQAIDAVLRPYAALIWLTLRNSGCFWSCPQRYVR